MDASTESRLQALEERVRTLEALLSAGPPPAPAAQARPAPWPAATAPAAAAPARVAAPREPLDLEQLFGGRVLAWLGGIAVVLAAVFFLVMAVHNGWIDETTRVVLAFLGSTALVSAGVWLYERKGKTQAALAAVAAGLAALDASATTATTVYHLVAAPVGLVIAGLVLGVGVAVAVTRLLASFLYGVSTTDAFTFTAIPLLLTVVALLACYLPARRATKVEPLVALRYE